MSQCKMRSYPITHVINGDFTLSVPFSSDPLYVGCHNGKPYVCFRVRTDLADEPRYFHIRTDGQELDYDWIYVGSFIQDHATYHVFEEYPKRDS